MFVNPSAKTFSRAAAFAASNSFFVRPDTYLTMLFPLASVPTVILARYLPSFCFAILLPLSSIYDIVGARDSSFLAPFPFLRSARLQPCGIFMPHVVIKKQAILTQKSVDTLSVLMYNVTIKRKGDKKCLIKKLSEIG